MNSHRPVRAGVWALFMIVPSLRMHWGLCVWAAALLAAAPIAESAEPNWDIVVYGGTSAGVCSAVQAARMGKQVVLIEPGRHVGGMTTSGLSLTDIGQVKTIGGIADEFYAQIYRYYLTPAAWKYANRTAFFDWMPLHWGVDGRRSEKMKRQYIFEPHVAEAVFNDLLRRAQVKVVFGERLDLRRGVAKRGPAIESIAMESGRRFSGKEFIDATYEGDLMAHSGVRYTVGRESDREYGETLNGKYPLPSTRMPVDPFVVPGDRKSGLLPPAIWGPDGQSGDRDGLVQSYNFRLCLTDVSSNRVPISKPADYDPRDYELLARYVAAKRGSLHPGISRTGPFALAGDNVDLGIKYDLMPNRKTDSNDGSAFGSDLSGGSQEWPEGNYATRDRIWHRHQSYIQGLLWFLANDERVPLEVRGLAGRWGLSKDEFGDNGNWPYQLYVREARRMRSDYVVTEGDATGKRRPEDPVALASYPLDSHSGRYYVDQQGTLWRESGFYVHCGVIPISYRAIRPSGGQCSNLLVPGCISATHAAYASVRMEPVFMMLGQAAATAACLAIDQRITVQAVPYSQLRARLAADGQVVDTQGIPPSKG